MLPKNAYICPISKKLFFDPVYLLSCRIKDSSRRHIFEREILLDSLKKNLNCPLCNTCIESENQIQPAQDIKKTVNEEIQKNNLLACDQYLPRDVIFNLLTDQNLTMPLERIEKILKLELSIDKPDSIFCDNFTQKKSKLILCALKTQPRRMAYFLWQSLQTSQLKIITRKLIDMDAFNEITINQFITCTVANQQELNSVSYLLLSNAEGREILKNSNKLLALIGEKLSADSLKQFLHQNTHKGTLYYLLTDEDIGQKILKNHTRLQEQMSHLENSDESLLSRKIVDGPDKGQSFRDLYKQFIDSSSAKCIK